MWWKTNLINNNIKNIIKTYLSISIIKCKINKIIVLIDLKDRTNWLKYRLDNNQIPKNYKYNIRKTFENWDYY